MLVVYPCAMKRRNTHQQRKGNLFKCAVAVTIVLHIYIDVVTTAPTSYDSSSPPSSEISEYFSDISGCYYNFQRYEEGDRIVTNEPCLNCTCHNRMLMCYLRVCPFTKAIGQDCTIEKKPDQCCPIITCPEVPVKLLTSSTTSSPTPTTPTTEIGFHDDYGCTIHNSFYADGAQVPSDPGKPCELCYCIRNRTACVMQECTLHVEGCKPVYQDGVCCPVRYDCDYEKEFTSTSLMQTSDGNIVKSTTYASVVDCQFGNQSYADGELITTDKPCEHCYCMRGDIVCAVQDCGEPLRGKDCVPTMPPPELCCPSSYDCPNDTPSTEGSVKVSESFNTDSPLHTSVADLSPLPSRNPAILSQEQIYEKLGEPTSYPTLTSESSILSSFGDLQPQMTTLTQSSESIQYDENTSATIQENDKSSSSLITEKLMTKETQPADYTTERAPTYRPSLPSAEPEVTINNEEVTELPVSYNGITTIKTPESSNNILSFNPSSNADEELATNLIHQSTRIPFETTKFESNDIADKVTTESALQDSLSSNENSETTPHLSTSKNKPGVEDHQMVDEPYSSSETNHYTFTTREFEKSTTVMKEDEMITTNTMEDVVPTAKPSQDLPQQLSERVTNNIDTSSEKIIEPTTIKETSLDPTSISYSEISSVTANDKVGTAQSGIPGEGSCLVDGITYLNTSIIESSNPCHSKCVCLSSIPTCTLISCKPPPSNPKCMPVQIQPESCCPDYVCSGTEHEQVVQTVQIPSHNQIASDHVENDQEEDIQNENPGGTGNHPTEGVTHILSESDTSSENIASYSQPHEDTQPLPTNIPPSQNQNDTSEAIEYFTKASESTTIIPVTELPVKQTQEPTNIITDKPDTSSSQYHDVTEVTIPETTIYLKHNYTQTEIVSRLPPIIVTDIPEVPTEPTTSDSTEVLVTTKESTTFSSSHDNILSPVTLDENIDNKTPIITSIDDNDVHSSSPEYTEQDEVSNTARPIISEESITRQTSVSWNVNQTEDDTQTTYNLPSDSPEHIQKTSSSTILSISYSENYTEEPSSSSFTTEEVQLTTVPSLADFSSTKKETETEIYPTTNQPNDNEAPTTIHLLQETTFINKDSYNLPGLYSTTSAAEDPNKETAGESFVTTTAAVETTMLLNEDVTTQPSMLSTKKTGSAEIPIGKPVEPIATTILSETSSEYNTVTEPTYTNENQYSSLPTTGSKFSADYNEIKTTPPPSPLPSSFSSSGNVLEESTTAVSSSDEVPTNKIPETNKVAAESGSADAAQPENITVPSDSSATEKESVSSTLSSYSPISHPMWTPKPIDNIDISSTNIGKITTSTETNFHSPSLVHPTGGMDINNNGVINGPDNTSVEEYDEEPSGLGPGACRYNGKMYVSAQQIPRDDPCDFCFCFRSDIICLQQSCPPPIHGCRQEPIQGFCCPRYECPVARDIAPNATIYSTTAQSTSSTTTGFFTRPARNPHDSLRSNTTKKDPPKKGCVINGYFYNVGEDIAIASGPCLECMCGPDGRMKCEPKLCSPEPYVRQMMEESNYRRR